MITCPRCGREEPNDDARFCTGCGENLAQFREEQEAKRKDTYIGHVFEEKYMILNRLGDGGMGTVYLAEQLSLNKQVALKILHKDMLQNETQVKRFQREAWSASRLDHPNSIGIIDVGRTDDGAHFIVMEYLRGTELAELINNEFPLTPERIVKIMSQVLSVLTEAHENKIIHRDLKPENIMLIKRAEQEDFVKVLDFGIAKLHERDPDQPALTMQGMVCGTPEYMSPEQAMGQDLDPRTDVYSTGCILYELLTGRVPFTGNNYQAILGMHIREMPTWPSELKKELRIHKGLEEVAMRAMAKNKDDRYQNALEMKHALEAALGGASTTKTTEPAPEQKGKTMVMGQSSETPPSQTATGGDEPPPMPTAVTNAQSEATSLNASETTENLKTLDDIPAENSGMGLGAILGIALLLIAALAVGGYFLLMGDEPKPEEAVAQQEEAEETETNNAEAAATKTEASADKKGAESAPAEEAEAALKTEDKTAKEEAAEEEKAEGAEKRTADAEAIKPVQKAKQPLKSATTLKRPVKVAKREPAKLALSLQEKKTKAKEHYNLGTNAFKKGNVTSAIRHWEQTRKLTPSMASVYKKLGMAYMRQGKKSAAKLNFGKYLRYAPKAKDAPRIKELFNAL